MLVLAKYLSLWLSCFFLLVGTSLQAKESSEEIRFVSEIAKPYFWIDENGDARGINVDLAEQLTQKLDLAARKEHMPWARAFQETLEKPNVVLLSLLRTDKREAQFQWLGKVHQVKSSLASLSTSTHIQLDSLNDAKAFRVGTIRGYGSADFLQSKGFVEAQNLLLVSDTERLWNMLYEGRLDLLIANLNSDRVIVESLGLDPNRLEEKLRIPEQDLDLYVGTGKKTSSEVTTKLSNALQEITNSGELQKILNKWGIE